MQSTSPCGEDRCPGAIGLVAGLSWHGCTALAAWHEEWQTARVQGGQQACSVLRGRSMLYFISQCYISSSSPRLVIPLSALTLNPSSRDWSTLANPPFFFLRPRPPPPPEVGLLAAWAAAGLAELAGAWLAREMAARRSTKLAANRRVCRLSPRNSVAYSRTWSASISWRKDTNVGTSTWVGACLSSLSHQARKSALGSG